VSEHEAHHEPRQRVGFLINPIAGMGGRVGLKGSDGVVDLAIARGAKPSAALRAGEMLDALRAWLAGHPTPPDFVWITCAGEMGEDALRAAGFEEIEVVYPPGATAEGRHASDSTDASDTRQAVQAFLASGVTLLVFCGGDGTARDICRITGRDTPILGVPAGVKMYSGVFGVSPARTAEILARFLEGRFDLADADVLDVDEDAFRAGRLDVELFDSARTPSEPRLMQSAKQVIEAPGEESAKAEIAEHVAEEFEAHPDALFLLGPGSTVASVARHIGLEKSLLGVDAAIAGKLVGRDLRESELLELIDAHPDVRLVLSPIGAQGFVLGRGNQQLSPAVLQRIGRERVIVVATPAKLDRTPLLRFDTGDPALDAELGGSGFFPVVTRYHVRRLVEVSV
jgi:predicted polyphosphate/ATP-dependent NAD kinase